MSTDPAVTYTSYLKIDELLSLQVPRSAGPDGEGAEHDELLFIVIHQVYELWFKQILHELDHVVGLLDEGESVRAAHTLGRVLRILKVLVSQLDVLETMTPLEFSSFRARLASASGFQSQQFRDLEDRLGLRDTPSPLFDALRRHLGIDGDDEAASFVAVYRSDPAGAELCERFVDLDEGLMEWRYRHMRMVQRTIGTKVGTGGSSGAEYLATTIRPAFPVLWEIRADL